MSTRSIYVSAVSVFTLLAASVSASAGLIADRATLLTQLGASALNEDFESWTTDLITDHNFEVLDADTVVEGQGPGIVNPGLRFTNIPSNRSNTTLQLDRRAQFSIPSGALVGEGGTLVIDFLAPVTHLGFDFFQFARNADTATVQVFAIDDTTLIYQTASALPAPNAPASTFFGYSDLGGVGSVHIRSTVRGWSPLIDDLSYGVVPETATAGLFGMGALAMGWTRSGRRLTR